MTRLERAALWPPYRGKHRVARLYSRYVPDFSGVAELPCGRYQVDTRYSEDRALLFGGMEQRELAWIRRQPHCEVAFDIGAHHAVYTIALAQIAAHVVAVEPFPASADIVEKNLALNGIRATTIRKAVGADGRPATLHLSSDGPQNHSFVDALRPTGEAIQVAATTLDELTAEHGVPGLVKIDVERGELEVFQGATELLARRETTFLFESVSWDERRALVHELLRDCGYRLATLERGREKPKTSGPLIVARP